jgi:hypothetical protein
MEEVVQMHGLLFACADVGSVKKGNFGWADSEGSEGTKPSELAAKVAAALSEKRSVALGFECPLHVPVPDAERELGKGRGGEGSRPWSAGAGCAALATGLVQAAWTLGEIRKQSPLTVGAYLDWRTFEEAGSGLLVWEAFVSGAGKGSGHVDDAARAVKAFAARLPRPETDLCASNPMSLGGFALLWSGWLISTEALKQPCIAIKA